MAAIYFPRGKKLKLEVSEYDGGDHTFSEAAAVQSALRDYWGIAYARKDFDCDTANKLMDLYTAYKGQDVAFENLELPDVEFFEDYLHNFRAWAAGRNGIPYSVYKSSIPLSAHIFLVLTSHMLSLSGVAALVKILDLEKKGFHFF